MDRRIFRVLVCGAVVGMMTACGTKESGNADSSSDSITIDRSLAVVNDSVEGADSAAVATVDSVKEEVKEATPSLPAGVVGEATVPGFGKVTFKKGGKYTATKGDKGRWEKKGKAVEFMPAESTMAYFILDGKVYEGSYNAAANTRSYEYQTAEGDLDEKTVKVNPKDGKPVTDFVWAD